MDYTCSSSDDEEEDLNKHKIKDIVSKDHKRKRHSGNSKKKVYRITLSINIILIKVTFVYVRVLIEKTFHVNDS